MPTSSPPVLLMIGRLYMHTHHLCTVRYQDASTCWYQEHGGGPSFVGATPSWYCASYRPMTLLGHLRY
eukprot:1757858-Rhodomonas_salina.1